MTNLTFFTLVLENFSLYLFALFLSGILYGYIIKKIVRSIIDPAFYALLSGVFAQSVPIFLFFTNEISTELFLYTLLSELTFWIFYFGTRKRDIDFSEYSFESIKIESTLFYLSILICTFCHLLTYILFGIPLFKISRLETYQNANGLGILSYFQNFTLFFCILYSYYLISKNKHKTLAYIILLEMFVFCLLSGSKSSILVFVSCYFFFLYYYKRQKFNIRKYLKYLVLLICFPLVVVTISSGGNLESSFLSIIMRLVANGDCYWMGFSNDIVANISIINELEYLFSRILGPFRIINYKDIDLPIGVQIDWIVYPNDVGIIKGPNTRLPILGWVLYKWGGLVISAIFGFLCSFWQTRLIQYLPKGILSVIIFGYIYTSLVSMFTDPLYSTSYIFNFSIFGSFLFVVIFLTKGRYIKLKKTYR